MHARSSEKDSIHKYVTVDRPVNGKQVSVAQLTRFCSKSQYHAQARASHWDCFADRGANYTHGAEVRANGYQEPAILSRDAGRHTCFAWDQSQPRDSEHLALRTGISQPAA